MRQQGDVPSSAPVWLWPLFAVGVVALAALWWWAL